MSIIEFPLSRELKATYTLNIGNLYFFEGFLVAEFNEGVNISLETFAEATPIIKKHFGSKKPFGFIANRINSYSIELTDASKFHETFKNLVGYAVITYNETSRKMLDLENHFFKFKREHFSSVFEAEKWIIYQIEKISKL